MHADMIGLKIAHKTMPQFVTGTIVKSDDSFIWVVFDNDEEQKERKYRIADLGGKYIKIVGAESHNLQEHIRTVQANERYYALVNILKKYGFEGFVHYTAYENLISIFKSGYIMSRREMERQGIEHMNRTDIVFIGTAIMDTIIKGFDPDPISVTGYRAGSATLNIGGEAVNGAIASAKLGMRTAILCHIGEDVAGDSIVWELAKYHVDIGGIVRSKDHPTPITTIFVSDDGNRKSITNTAHRYNFHPEQYRDAYSSAKAVVLGSLLRAPFDDPKVIRTLAEDAHSKGLLVFADTKLPNFTKLNLDNIADSLPFIDYITPNEDEGRYCTGEEEPEKMADVFLKKGVRGVVIKLGAKGCFLKDSHHTIYLPAHGIDAVDATGAGDNFLAGFASELIRGSEVEDALKFANACGAICTTAIGTGAALKSREQVLDFIRKND